MNTISWRVEVIDTPRAMRHCATCGAKTAHVSSDLFRINAHRKKLDIWLIYRCQLCKTTWNCTIVSRVNLKSIRADILSRYLANDVNLARQCALDTHLLRKNGAEVMEPPFEVVGQNIRKGERTLVNISCGYSADIRLSSILRAKLSLSRRELDNLVRDRYILLEEPGDVWKVRMTRSRTITIRDSTIPKEA